MDNFSFLNTVSVDYISSLYDRFLESPDSVEPSWKAFFQGFQFGISSSNQSDETSESTSKIKKEFQVIKLIDAYRKRGHLFTKTNPVRDRRVYSPSLDLENYGLTKEDLNSVFKASEIMGLQPCSLKKIIEHLEEVYCDSIGIEYMYIRRPEKVNWIQKQLNINNNHGKFSVSEKKQMLKKIIQAHTFEAFLQSKYVGQKRFSLEGGESLIPALDTLIENAAKSGVKEFILGMAHRGRLNTLTNIFGKSPTSIFNEFEGKDYTEKIFDGDVKYHLGLTSTRYTDSEININLNIVPNPSHLETVGAVVEGITRSKIDLKYNGDTSKSLPIVIHGDAAIAGQGLVYEIVQMSKLNGYSTGGTIHIVVNNQIGFTTNYLDARSSTYCTDVAKITLSPVLHVNADDIEAVIHATLFALKYRMQFQSDVFIDLLGYRKYGHNEGDEPRFTQPKLYKDIAKHKNSKTIYSEQLIAENVVTAEEVNKMEEDYKETLNQSLEVSKNTKKTEIKSFMEEEWKGFTRVDEVEMMKKVDTSVSKTSLDEIAAVLTTLPEGMKFLRKTLKLIADRKSMYYDKDKIDWGMGEALAFGSLLKEGFNVRMSGQDVERGTFSHRHAVLKAEDSEEETVLLKSINPEKSSFTIYNSLLSEYGVLGFDYGYAMASPNTLTLWEAQFGDFSNGAQIVIDQYISSGEDKWKSQNGIVLLLPHGYEGQGAEHSSARIERYLQLCGKDNLFIANCTTPASYFHILRRQMKTNYRKPLIIFTPKSLLRHPLAVSQKTDFADGEFQPLIPDELIPDKEVKTIVFCTGKFYYEIFTERKQRNRMDVSIVRLEQLYPLPTEQIMKVISQYKNCDDIVWAQEEPRNMGVWSHLLLHLPIAQKFRPVTRRFYGVTASGSPTRFKSRQSEVLEYIFDKTEDNFDFYRKSKKK